MQSSGNCETPKIRAFIGIEVTNLGWIGDLREALTAESLPGAQKLRLTPDSNLHLTLKFLGTVNSAAIPELSLHLGQVCAKHAPFVLACSGLGHFKQLIWAGLNEDPALVRLAKDIETCCSLLGYASEEKSFKPHITVARYGKAAQPPLQKLQDKYAEQDWFTQTVNEICLYQSETLSSGAKYSVLDRFALNQEKHKQE